MKKIFFYSFLILILATACKNNTKQKIPDAGNKIIQASEINRKIKKGEAVLMRNAAILGDIDFTLAENSNIINSGQIKHYVNSSVTLYDCTIKGKVIACKKTKNFLEISKFNKNITFVNCTFQDTVDFSNSEFTELVNFSNSLFQNYVDFKSVGTGRGRFLFTGTHFIKFSKFDLMNIGGFSDFSNAVFDEDVLFQSSKFEYPARFAVIKFNKNAIFTNTKFYDDVFFNYSEFARSIKFNSSVFRGRTEFIKSKFNMISEFKNCLFLCETKFSDADLKGILTFENSIFYISNPEKFKIKISDGSDYILDKTQSLIKN